jgi:hypothetical protein
MIFVIHVRGLAGNDRFAYTKVRRDAHGNVIRRPSWTPAGRDRHRRAKLFYLPARVDDHRVGGVAENRAQ